MAVHLHPTIAARGSPATERSYLPVAAVGLAAVMLALAVGALVGLYQGDFWAQSALARAADHVRQGVTAATGAWSTGVVLFGISLLMTGVVIVLRSVVRAIRDELGKPQVSALPGLLQPSGPRDQKKGAQS